MSVYLRTSLKAGPFRFNLSRSGVGVSVGMPGFRVGKRPRSNYIRVNSRTVSYRATSPSLPGQPRQTRPRTPATHVGRPPYPASPNDSAVVHEIPTASVEELRSSGPSDLVSQLQAAANRQSVWPWVLLASIAVSAFLLLLPLLVLLPLVYWLYLRDRAAQRVVTFYELDGPSAEPYERMVGSAEAVRACRRPSTGAPPCPRPPPRHRRPGPRVPACTRSSGPTNRVSASMTNWWLSVLRG
ncbi:DUF4236 domain-containing protein [Streptantibioticus parmotrematis]|uniref:DUF4236 domain-containing protein n=1 Tax=Streptantibioticus parmotrematis TaxID=2873249 RepID=UPI0033EE5ABC